MSILAATAGSQQQRQAAPPWSSGCSVDTTWTPLKRLGWAGLGCPFSDPAACASGTLPLILSVLFPAPFFPFLFLSSRPPPLPSLFVCCPPRRGTQSSNPHSHPARPPCLALPCLAWPSLTLPPSTQRCQSRFPCCESLGLRHLPRLPRCCTCPPASQSAREAGPHPSSLLSAFLVSLPPRKKKFPNAHHFSCSSSSIHASPARATSTPLPVHLCQAPLSTPPNTKSWVPGFTVFLACPLLALVFAAPDTRGRICCRFNLARPHCPRPVAAAWVS